MDEMSKAIRKIIAEHKRSRDPKQRRRLENELRKIYKAMDGILRLDESAYMRIIGAER